MDPIAAAERSGWLEPVEIGGADERLWLDCDLSSFAGHRLGDDTDPRALTDERRAEWQARATTSGGGGSLARRGFQRAFWLVEDGQRVGTVALSPPILSADRIHLWSFYVFPPLRGAGRGRRALDAIVAAVATEGVGVRLATEWAWQRVVWFYLRAGFWLYMWKDSLDFYRAPGWAPPEITVDAAGVSVGARGVVLASARMEDGQLIVDEHPDDVGGEERWHADSTLALVLALSGLPLIRSAEAFEQYGYGDGGPPEALARRIEVWEAYDRRHGWRVDTPRLPGLTYRTWAELEAAWEEELRRMREPD